MTTVTHWWLCFSEVHNFSTVGIIIIIIIKYACNALVVHNNSHYIILCEYAQRAHVVISVENYWLRLHRLVLGGCCAYSAIIVVTNTWAYKYIYLYYVYMRIRINFIMRHYSIVKSILHSSLSNSHGLPILSIYVLCNSTLITCTPSP